MHSNSNMQNNRMEVNTGSYDDYFVDNCCTGGGHPNHFKYSQWPKINRHDKWWVKPNLVRIGCAGS